MDARAIRDALDLAGGKLAASLRLLDAWRDAPAEFTTDHMHQLRSHLQYINRRLGNAHAALHAAAPTPPDDTPDPLALLACLKPGQRITLEVLDTPVTVSETAS